MINLVHPPSSVTYNANLEFFRTFSPELYQQIAANGEGGLKFLNVNEDDFDVEVGRKRFYGGGAIAITKHQVEEFWQNQSNRIYLMPEQDVHENGVVSQFFNGLMKRAANTSISFSEHRFDSRSYHLVILGVGLGVHLPMLVDRLKCRTLTIVEPNLELFRASLHTLNWRAFNDYFSVEKGYQLNLLMTNESQTAYDYIRNIVKYQRTPAFLDGFCLFQHYETDLFRDVGARIFQTPKDLFSNFGFLYDDMNMVQNTYFNLRDNKPRIFQGSGPPLDLPAFVVGAGPSLDTSIDTIRLYQGCSIIISCGTALSALLKNGVTPDFHVELENIPSVYEAAVILSKDHDLSGISLVGSTSVFPPVAEMFGTVVMFFRGGVASYPMFRTNDNAEIPYPGPQVVNLGTSLAGEIGCQKVYFFGVDLGSADRNQHYARKTSKFKGQLVSNWEKDGLELTWPGNLGGMAYSHPSFIECLTILEEDIRYNKTVREYFNCSSGIAIGGAKPLRPEDVSLEVPTKSKHLIVSEMIAQWGTYSREMFDRTWDGDAHLAANAVLHKHLKTTINAAECGYEGTINGLVELAHSLPQNTDRPIILLYRGSMISALATAYFFLCRLGNDNDRSKFADIVREEMTTLIDAIAERVDTFLQQLRDSKKAEMQNYIEIH